MGVAWEVRNTVDDLAGSVKSVPLEEGPLALVIFRSFLGDSYGHRVENHFLGGLEDLCVLGGSCTSMVLQGPLVK